jgi:hypothetical protein
MLDCFLVQQRLIFAPAPPVYGGAACPILFAGRELNSLAIFLVTNMELVGEACYWYDKRYRIETFFSDEKSRGFHLNKSHIDDPARLARLMIAACLAYIWIVFLGALACLKVGPLLFIAQIVVT